MKNTVLTLQKQKEEHDKIVMVTAYDYTTAKIMDEAGVNTILVGDSLGMVMLGYEDTLSVTMEDMIHHTAAVSRGAKDAFVVADMPFMSYQTSVYDESYLPWSQRAYPHIRALPFPMNPRRESC